MILDASAVLCVLLDNPAATASAIFARLRGEQLQTPHLLDIEIAHAARRLVLTNQISPERGRAALVDLGNLAITRYPHYPFLDRIWQLRSNLTAYDAAYVSLAEFLDAPLITLDARLSRAGSRAAVEVF